MKKLLQTLTETFAPSGYEDAIREIVMKEIYPLVDEARVDALGNLITRLGEKTDAGMRVMIAAHMDEIGLIATHIDQHGYVRFMLFGAPFARYLLGGRVRFVNGTQGVIGCEPPERSNEIPPVDKLFIDVGATSGDDCPVKVGDVATFERPFLEVGRRLVAKSLDNRAGVAVVIETLRRLKRHSGRIGKGNPNAIFFVFTAQEEVGARGAGVSAFGIDPDIGLAVDVTPTGDTPNAVKRDISLGKGPAIKVKDSLMLADPRVVAWMSRVAETENLPTQREVLTGGSTDARAIQLTRAGVPAGGLMIPCRYIHSPSEMVDVDDLENAVQLLVAMLSAPILIE